MEGVMAQATVSPTLVEVGSLFLVGKLQFDPSEEIRPGNLFNIVELGPRLIGHIGSLADEGVSPSGPVRILRLAGDAGEQFRVTNADLLKHGDPYLSWWQMCILHLHPGPGWAPEALLGDKGHLGLIVRMPPRSPLNCLDIRSRYDWTGGGEHVWDAAPAFWDVGTFFVVR
jgi:hypothetical protein